MYLADGARSFSLWDVKINRLLIAKSPAINSYMHIRQEHFQALHLHEPVARSIHMSQCEELMCLQMIKLGVLTSWHDS